MANKLENYFDIKYISSNEENLHKRCFIYDPENQSAFFCTNAEDNDTFIVKKTGIRCYIRNINSGSCETIPNLPHVNGLCNIPLLKSNLQKGIRRMNAKVAISSTLALLQLNPTELFRRLPIICIEDVCPTDAFPILIWFMMTNNEYKLNMLDKYIILQIVNNLCETHEYYGQSTTVDTATNTPTIKEWTVDELEHKPNANILLSIYYRIQYGGKKEDMNMLSASIEYYCNSKHVNEMPYTNWELPLQLYHKIQILPEAIDFHPYPEMVYHIYKKCGFTLPITEIQNTIWRCESAVNLRKRYTILMADNHKKTNVWELIKYHVADYRDNIMKTPEIN